MKLHELRQSDGAKHSRKRKGRGHAGGQGKTAGYGTKGSGSRSGRGGKPYFEGGQLPLVNRLPVKRGFRNVNRVDYNVVNVYELNNFEAGTEVTVELLKEIGLVRGEKPVKILGDGELDRALTVSADKFTKTAVAKIEAAGGTVK